jgi:hypothetical protein
MADLSNGLMRTDGNAKVLVVPLVCLVGCLHQALPGLPDMDLKTKQMVSLLLYVLFRINGRNSNH